MESLIHKQIFDEIQKAEHLLFIADERTDGDSLGSSLGMADYVLSLGKQVTVFVSEAIPQKYHVLPHIRLCTWNIDEIKNLPVDLVVTFDCSDELYVAHLTAQLSRPVKVINIDHHATNTHFGDINQVIVESPATTDIVHHFFKTNHLQPTRAAATALLCGIAFDTTVFTNEATNHRAFDTASELVLCGARVQDVITMMFSGRSVDALRLWGLALERLRAHPEFGFLTTFLRTEDIVRSGVSEEDVQGLSDFLNIVTEAKTLFVLREKPGGGIKLSMRSRTCDVGKLSRLFGGGGHRAAAGFFLAGMQFVHTRKNGWTVEEVDLV